MGDYTFYFVAEPPELVGSNTNGFIKVLDQTGGYVALGLESVSTTAGGELSVSFTIDESMVGKLLQFGFDTLAAGYDNSGMQYDNLVFGAAGSNNGSGGGTTSNASATFDLLMRDCQRMVDVGQRLIRQDPAPRIKAQRITRAWAKCGVIDAALRRPQEHGLHSLLF